MDSSTGDSFVACFLDCFDPEGLQSLYIDEDDSAASGGGHQHQDRDGYSSSPPDAAGSNDRSSSATAAASRSVVTERRCRRRFNDTLYALRSVVPNITKMDSASVVKDAIEQLQQLERQLLAEICLLLLAGTASSIIPAATVGSCCDYGHAAVGSPTKKMKMALLSHGSSCSAAASLPVDALEAQELHQSEIRDLVETAISHLDDLSLEVHLVP